MSSCSLALGSAGPLVPDDVDGEAIGTTTGVGEGAGRCSCFFSPTKTPRSIGPSRSVGSEKSFKRSVNSGAASPGSMGMR